MLSQREVTRRAPQRLDSNLTPNGAWNVQSTLWYNSLWYGIHRVLPEVDLVASGDCSILASCDISVSKCEDAVGLAKRCTMMTIR